MNLRPPRALSVLVGVLLAASGCRSQVSQAVCTSGELELVSSGRLTAGVDLTNPPFAFTDPNNGKATGFEVDLVRAMAKAMELKLTLLNRGGPSLVPATLAHQVDVAAASIADDAELPSDVCRSTPYMDADLAVVVTAAGVRTTKTLADLGGRTVGVVRNTPAARWAAGNLRGSRIARVAAADDAFAALTAQTVDAVIVDRPVALRAQRTSGAVRAVETIRLSRHYVLIGAADTAVMAPVNTALAKLESDGTIAALRQRWFGPGI